ncbi:flavodoxin family protein [Cuneatibacter caecimuris]|uniref:Multimeric flavodoxin WrbA n=1 Tax=Cuneatibacter caecimuris TaxID=1796618 RepID=A0A4V2F5I0_9FIRM|nr:flavodoxin family protein [Cuneatibacter caecimuris]RZS92889.1 multimeric flavodoxin WrbA [Cuneatibacter caecimuris]
MKVLLINGSPHETGCTYTALHEAAQELEKNGVSTQIFWLGKKPVASCMACGACAKLGKCVVEDAVNEALELAKDADGFIFGSPVHYAAASGAITAFLGRFFYAGDHSYKPGAAVVSCRRGGASAAFDQLNKFFTISNMPVVSSNYWNMVHGSTPEEVYQDEEGMQGMRMLGKNMAWLLKCIEAGKKAGLGHPEQEQPRMRTNFIR